MHGIDGLELRASLRMILWEREAEYDTCRRTSTLGGFPMYSKKRAKGKGLDGAECLNQFLKIFF